MANSRRQRRTTSTTSRAARRADVAETAPATSSVHDTDAVDWKEEYSYVFRDLRHLTVVTVAIFALLLIIGFFI